MAEIDDQGYTIIPDFISPEEVATIRHAFDSEVAITGMRAIGTNRGQTLRSQEVTWWLKAEA